MSKRFLAAVIARHTNISQHDASRLSQIIIDQFAAALQERQALRLTGVGSLVVVTRGPRQGVNPRTLKEFRTPMRLSVKFKPSPILLKKLNGR